MSPDGSCPSVLHILFRRQDAGICGAPALDLVTSQEQFAVGEGVGWPLNPILVARPSPTFSQCMPPLPPALYRPWCPCLLASCWSRVSMGSFSCSLRLVRKRHFVITVARPSGPFRASKRALQLPCARISWPSGEGHGPLLRIMFLKAHNIKFAKETNYIKIQLSTEK